MTTSNELEIVFEKWISLKCPHCGRLNPFDVIKCIYCNCVIGRRAALKLQAEDSKQGGQCEQRTS